MMRRIAQVTVLAAVLAMTVYELNSEAAPAQVNANSEACSQVTYCLPSRWAGFIVDGGPFTLPAAFDGGPRRPAQNSIGMFPGCGDGQAKQPFTVHAEVKDSTTRYFVWRKGANKENWKERAFERCTTCTAGNSYQASIDDVQGGLVCLFDSTDDAGMAQILAIDGGRKVVVEYAR